MTDLAACFDPKGTVWIEQAEEQKVYEGRRCKGGSGVDRDTACAT